MEGLSAHEQGQTTTPGTPCPTVFKQCMGSFMSHRIVNNKELGEGSYSFFVLVRQN